MTERCVGVRENIKTTTLVNAFCNIVLGHGVTHPLGRRCDNATVESDPMGIGTGVTFPE